MASMEFDLGSAEKATALSGILHQCHGGAGERGTREADPEKLYLFR